MKGISNNSEFSRQDAKIEQIENKFNGFFQVNEYKFRHKLYQGGTSELVSREVFERGDAVMLIPYDPVTDSVVIVEQFRIGAYRTMENPWLIEFVAGMFGENESPKEVAIREAKEEADLDLNADFVEPVMQYLTSPGGTTENIHMYVAKVDSTQVEEGVFGLDHEHEDIRVSTISREQAMQYMSEGKICNASTIIGLQWLALNYQALQQKWQS